MVLMLRRLFAIYFNGSMSDFIFLARILPTLTKKSLNEFAITSGLVVGIPVISEHLFHLEYSLTWVAFAHMYFKYVFPCSI